jgi:hypothetical protein
VAATAPVPRPTHHLLGDGPTARWHSRATVGLCPDPSRSRGKLAGTPTLLSLAAPVDGFIHRRSLRARSPFTRSCRCFCSAITELIRDQTPPDDFCNCNFDVRATKPIRLSIPRRDGGLDHLPFLCAPRRSSLSSGTWRAALRSLLPIPVLVRPGYPGLPSRDTFSSAPPPPSCPVGA